MQNMDYLTLAKRFKGHKSGSHIARVLLKNAKRKGALGGAPISNKENKMLIG